MRFALFTAIAVSAASVVYAAPMEDSAELVARQATCDIAACATGLLTTIPGLLGTATALQLPLLLSCATSLVTSPTTAVPTCLVAVVVLTGSLPTGCVTSCLPV